MYGGGIISKTIEINQQPIKIEQLKILKIGNNKVNYDCLYPDCSFYGIFTIDEIDKHIKKYHHKGGLFGSISARYLSKIEKIK